jgi:hypothetical protein
MLNRGYAYTTIISSKYHGRTLLSHLASLYPHSTAQVWQQKLNNREVTVNGVTATGSESLTSGQTLVFSLPETSPNFLGSQPVQTRSKLVTKSIIVPFTKVTEAAHD